MPTWRKLHVKAVESLDINDMPDDFHRLLWVMLPLGLDRDGRGLDNPAWVKAKIMPLRVDVTPDMIGEAMDWYESRGMIERYQVESRSYFWVPSFLKYQGSTLKERKSEYPDPPELVQSKSRPTPELVQSKSVTDSDADADADADSDVDAEVDIDAPKGAAPAAAVLLWEEAVGRLITAAEAREIMVDEADYPHEHIAYAIRESVRHDKRNWAYVQAILRGGCKGMGKQRRSPPPKPEPDADGVVMMPVGGSHGKR